jgi:hypothetical protein
MNLALTLDQIQRLRIVSTEIRQTAGVNQNWANDIDVVINQHDLDEDDQAMVANSEAWNHIRTEHNLRSIWQILAAPDLNAPHNFPGVPQLIYREHDGVSHEGRPQEIIVAVQGQTWLDLWRACDQAIYHSQDSVHMVIRELRQDTRDTTKLILITERLGV